jgi:hypothetical protein
MIEPFRNGIISACLPQEKPTSYFYQFQYLIYELSFGER